MRTQRHKKSISSNAIPPACDLYFPNTVCTLHLSCTLNLVRVSRIFLSKYDSLVFPAVVVKVKNTQATVIIFETGYIVITGSKAIDDEKRAKPGIEMALLTAQLIVYRLILCLKIKIEMFKIRIPNVVASQTLGMILDIDAMCVEYNAHKEKGRFPGLRISDDTLHVTFIVFKNGNVNVTGMKGLVTGEVENLAEIKEKIEEFKEFEVVVRGGSRE
jgi:transcription initiation factor TFIID TATA-box-binding protein